MTIFKTGAQAEDARDEMIEEMEKRICPQSLANDNQKYENCLGERCAVFNSGSIDKIEDNNYALYEPCCGMCVI